MQNHLGQTARIDAKRQGLGRLDHAVIRIVMDLHHIIVFKLSRINVFVKSLFPTRDARVGPAISPVLCPTRLEVGGLVEKKMNPKLQPGDVAIFLAFTAIVVPLLWILRNRRQSNGG